MENTERVRRRVAAAFTDSGLKPEVVDGIAFHMTDWKENLEELVELYDQPEQLSDERIRKIVLGFLAHVPNHVAAAKKLAGVGPIEDVFKVGVLEEDN